MVYLLITVLAPACIVFLIEQKKVYDLKEEFNRHKSQKKYYILTGVSFAFAIIFYLLALRQGQVSIVAPLSSVTVLLNVLAGYIFLKERDDLAKRIVASVLVIIGVFLLV